MQPIRILVLGYGNRSRRDDGVGWHVVEELSRRQLTGIKFLTAHQLDVDHAETVSSFEVVIFVDAATTESSGAIVQTDVAPYMRSNAVAHYLTPGDVLALCKMLYDRQPRGILFSIRGHDFNFGTEFSPETTVAATETVERIARLIHDLQSCEVACA